MGLPGLPEMLIIGACVLLLFGASKLPKLGGAIGESIKNFKKGVKEDENKAIEEEASASTETKSEAKGGE